MNKMFKHVYDRPPHKGVEFKLPSLVQPQYARQSDINVMIQRALGGDVSVFNASRGTLGVDASEAPESLHDAMNITARAETAWNDMPDSLRHTYGNKENFLAAVEAASQKRQDDKPLEPVSDKPAKPVDKSVDKVTPSGAEPSMA